MFLDTTSLFLKPTEPHRAANLAVKCFTFSNTLHPVYFGKYMFCFDLYEHLLDDIWEDVH